MRSVRWFLRLAVVFWASCDDAPPQHPAVCTDAVGDNGSALVLSGTIERSIQNHAFNDEIAIDPAAHVAFSLQRYEGEDADAPTTFTADVPFDGFPFEFRLLGSAREAFAQRESSPGDGSYFVRAEIVNHVGCELAVGDLVNEAQHTIDGPTSDFVVTVVGLEDCAAEDAGGFCAN